MVVVKGIVVLKGIIVVEAIVAIDIAVVKGIVVVTGIVVVKGIVVVVGGGNNFVEVAEVAEDVAEHMNPRKYGYNGFMLITGYVWY